MKVYRGSHIYIDRIDLSKSKRYRDFGKCFYVTKFKHHAINWASNKGRINKNKGVVTEFDFIDSNLTTELCAVKRFEGYTEEWLDFVIKNRDVTKNEQQHNYDIVEGPVADDKVQENLDLYLDGTKSKEEFLEMMKYHEETHQICFCTFKSLQFLRKIECNQYLDIAKVSEPIIEKIVLEKNIDEKTATLIFYKSNTFKQLSDTNTGLILKPWQEVYEMLISEINL